jgi:hypothetical protein
MLVGQSPHSSPSEASQQVEIESFPPILVLHLERFLYDATAGGMVKINKPIQLVPELEIPPRTGFSPCFPCVNNAENRAWLGLSRNNGARYWEICGARAV